MSTKERARAMRAEGKTIAAISSELGIGAQWAYKCAGGGNANPPKETEQSVVRYGAHNGGCSTQSGRAPVSLARVPTIDGVAA